jgi:hypothetical protein
MKERANAKVDGVETISGEVCTQFVEPKNVSWMNAHISVANVGCTKVGTTMNRCHCLRGPAKKVYEMVAMHRAVRTKDVDVACYCRSSTTGNSQIYDGQGHRR